MNFSQLGQEQSPLQLIHTDVCCPIEIKTWGGNRWLVTFLDDYTHYAEISLLKFKSDIQDALVEFVKRTEAHWNLKVSKIRYDNGREYVNDRMTNWAKKNGIVFDCTIPYSPQQNGKAEGLNRTLMEKNRALLFDSNLGNELGRSIIHRYTLVE